MGVGADEMGVIADEMGVGAGVGMRVGRGALARRQYRDCRSRASRCVMTGWKINCDEISFGLFVRLTGGRALAVGLGVSLFGAALGGGDGK